MKNEVVAWWSGGITSAVACLWAVQTFKKVHVIFIDTFNEDNDTYRFKADCEKLYGQEISVASRIPDDYKSIRDVWRRFKSLNNASGAICSSELKRAVREKVQGIIQPCHQVFGFDANEPKRFINMARNYPEIGLLAPLVSQGKTKAFCVRVLNDYGIKIPRSYTLGFRNNNCMKTGCVRGGIGYWQMMAEKVPEAFDAMADEEHFLTDLKGEPVTCLKDRTDGQTRRLFLKPHPNYPDIKDISMVKGRKPEELVECNGFCSTED